MTSNAKKHRGLLLLCFVISITILFVSALNPKSSQAHHKCCCGTSCCKPIGRCSQACVCTSNKQTNLTLEHIRQEFLHHRAWIIQILWEAHVLPSLLLMTEQMTAATMQQALGIGMLFDAKHQLESQRIFQELTAQAHKDYHPSEGLCEIGTNTRSLAASDRNSDFTRLALML